MVDVRGVTPILNVASVEASAAWFEALGWRLRFSHTEDGDAAGFAAMRCGTAEIFLCRDAQALAAARLRSFRATSRRAASG